jgi:hypothetical protein
MREMADDQEIRTMKTTPRTEADAVRASRRSLLPAGWHPASITEAAEKRSKAGNDMIEVTVMIRDAAGEDRTLRDWLTDRALGAAKLRHAADTVGALAKYEAGEISQDDFPGHDVMVKIAVEKKRGFDPRNVIEDYRAASSSVVPLRAASARPGGLPK